MRGRKNRRKSVKRAPSLPRLPRFTINWRALLLPPLILAAGFAVVVSAKELLDRPMGELRIEGTFQRVSALQIEAALAPGLERGFLSLDLDALRRRVEALDWVDAVKLGRIWPDRLVVRVTEHQAAARWGEGGLLNVRGALFTSESRYAFPELPQLAGPDGSEREVAGLYLAVRGRLAEAQLGLQSLSMDARGAFNLKLDGGQEIRLGRRATEDRLERFFEVVAPALGPELGNVAYVDLRYTNGFAVGWLAKPAAEPETEVADGRGAATRG